MSEAHGRDEVDTRHAGGDGRIPRRPVGPDVPASFSQSRLWALDQLGYGGPLYNICQAYHLQGALSLAALHHGFAVLMRRHPSWRTHFANGREHGIQIIDEQCEVPIEHCDLAALDADARTAEIQRLRRMAAQQAFDLRSAPLIRVLLIRLQPEEHVIVITVHHIVSDGWSAGIFTRELGEIYDASVLRRPAQLPELDIDYADFAVWQRARMAGAVLEQQLTFWHRQLQGAPEVMEIPTDRPRPSVMSHRGSHQTVAFPPGLALQLKQLARQGSSTLYVVLLAAFQILLSRLTAAEEIVLGTLVAGRRRRQTEGIIGFFANMLVLRTDLSGDPTVSEALRRARQTAAKALSYQDLPFEKLVEDLKPRRDLSRHPLFQVLFAFQNFPEQVLQLNGIAVSPLAYESEVSHFDMSLYLYEKAAAIEGFLEYSTDLFDATTITHLISRLIHICAQMAAQPGARLSQLSGCPAEERNKLLIEWNDTYAAYPDEQCLHHFLELHAHERPQAVAVAEESHTLTYLELNDQANQIAHLLQSLGAGVEDVVALCMERTTGMLAALMGILKAGAAFLPLDGDDPPERLAYMLEDAGVKWLLTSRGMRERVPTPGGLNVIVVEDAITVIECRPKRAATSGVTPDNLAYVIYTSGSTGKPKGVALQHRGLANLAEVQMAEFGLNSGNHILQFARLSFDAAVWEIAMAMRAGASLCLMPRSGAFSATNLVSALHRYNIDTVTLPPAALPLLDHEEFPALRTLIVAGEACPAELANAWAMRCRFIDAYGPTETTVCAALGEHRQGSLRVRIGTPIANTRSYVLDRHLELVPIGAVGELCVDGVGLARGYLNRSALTAERFIPNPFGASGSRLYRTGDLVRYSSDGHLEFVGRVDDQIKIRGYRVELGEIESALLSQPGIHRAAVTVQGSAPDRRLCAYVCADEDLSLQDMRMHLVSRLPQFMIPTDIIRVPHIPLTSNGKLDVAALPQREAAAAREYVAARTATEARLAEIWSRVLAADRVGMQDNFFDLGGHSISIVGVLTGVQRELMPSLTAPELFAYPTIEALAAFIDNTQGRTFDYAKIRAQAQTQREQAKRGRKAHRRHGA